MFIHHSASTWAAQGTERERVSVGKRNVDASKHRKPLMAAGHGSYCCVLCHPSSLFTWLLFSTWSISRSKILAPADLSYFSSSYIKIKPSQHLVCSQPLSSRGKNKWWKMAVFSLSMCMYVWLSGIFFWVELKGTSDGVMEGHATLGACFWAAFEAELLIAFQQQEFYHQS